MALISLHTFASLALKEGVENESPCDLGGPVGRDDMGQGTTATISGSVTDPSGAAITGAKITATSLETNVSRTGSSQADGGYSLLFLPIGTYKVEVDASGFKKFEQTGMVLDVNRNARWTPCCRWGR